MPPFTAAFALVALIATAQSGALRIVVIEGEDAVNIVQQKTAVAPVVEVRDRNDQPVAGAIVRFAIQQGRGTFAGARTLSVTTNAAGRAVATGLTPTGGGALQIGASATFQGQTVVATITQTNVMTAAEAAAAGSASSGTGASTGASSASGGAAGGGSGGMSGTTLGIVGGAVAGGAVAATTVLGGSDAEQTHVTSTYRGSFSMQTTFHLFTTNNGVVVGGCLSQPASLTGSVTVTLDERGQGEVELEWTESLTGTPTCLGISPHFGNAGPVTSATNISVMHESLADYDSQAGTVHIKRVGAFSGALNGGTVTGTVTMSHDQRLTAPASPGLVVDGGYPTISQAITLAKQ